MLGHQPVPGDGSDTSGTNETEPMETVILRLGSWVYGVQELPVRHPLPRLVRKRNLHRDWLMKSERTLESGSLEPARII